MIIKANSMNGLTSNKTFGIIIVSVVAITFLAYVYVCGAKEESSAAIRHTLQKARFGAIIVFKDGKTASLVAMGSNTEHLVVRYMEISKSPDKLDPDILIKDENIDDKFLARVHDVRDTDSVGHDNMASYFIQTKKVPL